MPPSLSKPASPACVYVERNMYWRIGFPPLDWERPGCCNIGSIGTLIKPIMALLYSRIPATQAVIKQAREPPSMARKPNRGGYAADAADLDANSSDTLPSVLDSSTSGCITLATKSRRRGRDHRGSHQVAGVNP